MVTLGVVGPEPMEPKHRKLSPFSMRFFSQKVNGFSITLWGTFGEGVGYIGYLLKMYSVVTRRRTVVKIQL